MGCQQEGEASRSGATAVTTPARTAFDLARWAPDLTERVTAVDALARAHGVDLDVLRVLRNRHLGVRRGGGVLALVDARAESPMESRARMALHLGGLPPPAVQHPVTARGVRYRLDLAYPEVLLAIESPRAASRDRRKGVSGVAGTTPTTREQRSAAAAARRR